MTRMSAGPRPRQRPLTPSCLMMALADWIAVGLSSALPVTARVDWYAWTVHTGLVRIVVIEPGRQSTAPLPQPHCPLVTGPPKRETRGYECTPAVVRTDHHGVTTRQRRVGSVSSLTGNHPCHNTLLGGQGSSGGGSGGATAHQERARLLVKGLSLSVEATNQNNRRRLRIGRTGREDRGVSPSRAHTSKIPQHMCCFPSHPSHLQYTHSTRRW